MSSATRESGYYWVKFRGEAEWQIAQFDREEMKWWFIGGDMPLRDNDTASEWRLEIGVQVPSPHKD